MIITQKYNSAHDIDPEFISDLENLLSACVPSFELIKKHEEVANEETHFAYYLFFGERTNAPIGFAQLEMQQQSTPKPGLGRFFRKPSTRKQIRWSIPGTHHEGFIFAPRYKQYAKLKAQKIFSEYHAREDISEQQLLMSTAYDSIEIPGERCSRQIPETLVKNKKNYAEFLGALATDLRSTVQSHWKRVHTEKIKMGEYTHFKECFEYKSLGATQYRELKQSPTVKKYLAIADRLEFLTLETEDELKCLVCFVTGKEGNGFYDILFNNFNSILAHQLAILNFYERESLSRLQFLGKSTQQDHLFELGFTKREQFLVSLKKDI